MNEKIRANRLKGVGEYYFSNKLREIAALKQLGKPIINLGIGNPDVPPPNSVISVLVDSLKEDNFHQYQSYKGLPELRNAIAQWYDAHYQVTLDQNEEILPLIGSKEGIMHVCMALINEGDRVLVPNPGYMAYAACVKLAGGIPVSYALEEESNYLPNLEEIEKIASDIKIMWINYPHMPTGAVMSENYFSQLTDLCHQHRIILINDNPYSFILNNKPMSLLKGTSKDQLILELNSLSKSHNMQGMRVGMLVGNATLIDYCLTFKSNMDSGMFKPIMRASIAALQQPKAWYKNINDIYKERKKIVVEIAKHVGCKVSGQQVGMFVWATIPSSWESSVAFSDYLLDTHHLFVPPGEIFGTNGIRYVRFSLCNHHNILSEVINRIKSNNEISNHSVVQ